MNSKKLLIFLGGFIAGVVVTFLTGYLLAKRNTTSNEFTGLNEFSEKGKCLTTTSKFKSCEVEVFQVIAQDAALANVKYYQDKNLYGNETYRDYDLQNEIVVLLLNDKNETYYDNQKMDVTKRCLRQIGTYQYQTKSEFGKTVPAIIIE